MGGSRGGSLNSIKFIPFRGGIMTLRGCSWEEGKKWSPAAAIHGTLRDESGRPRAFIPLSLSPPRGECRGARRRCECRPGQRPYRVFRFFLPQTAARLSDSTSIYSFISSGIHASTALFTLPHACSSRSSPAATSRPHPSLPNDMSSLASNFIFTILFAFSHIYV